MTDIVKSYVTEEGYKAVILYVGDSHHCGYIGVTKDHSLYWKHYDDILCADIEVHGGLTFSEDSISEDFPADDNLWWLGFDCAHYGDKTNSVISRDFVERGGIFRDKDFCVKELHSMSRQMKEL